jgi:hypothetical protein
MARRLHGSILKHVGRGKHNSRRTGKGVTHCTYVLGSIIGVVLCIPDETYSGGQPVLAISEIGL